MQLLSPTATALLITLLSASPSLAQVAGSSAQNTVGGDTMRQGTINTLQNIAPGMENTYGSHPLNAGQNPSTMAMGAGLAGFLNAYGQNMLPKNASPGERAAVAGLANGIGAIPMGPAAVFKATVYAGMTSLGGAAGEFIAPGNDPASFGVRTFFGSAATAGIAGVAILLTGMAEAPLAIPTMGVVFVVTAGGTIVDALTIPAGPRPPIPNSPTNSNVNVAGLTPPTSNGSNNSGGSSGNSNSSGPGNGNSSGPANGNGDPQTSNSNGGGPAPSSNGNGSGPSTNSNGGGPAPSNNGNGSGPSTNSNGGGPAPNNGNGSGPSTNSNGGGPAPSNNGNGSTGPTYTGSNVPPAPGLPPVPVDGGGPSATGNPGGHRPPFSPLPPVALGAPVPPSGPGSKPGSAPASTTPASSTPPSTSGCPAGNTSFLCTYGQVTGCTTPGCGSAMQWIPLQKTICRAANDRASAESECKQVGGQLDIPVLATPPTGVVHNPPIGLASQVVPVGPHADPVQPPRGWPPRRPLANPVNQAYNNPVPPPVIRFRQLGIPPGFTRPRKTPTPPFTKPHPQPNPWQPAASSTGGKTKTKTASLTPSAQHADRTKHRLGNRTRLRDRFSTGDRRSGSQGRHAGSNGGRSSLASSNGHNGRSSLASGNGHNGRSGGNDRRRHSDIRLKEAIVSLARLDSGIGLYSFRYKGGDRTTYVGVMAQEVQGIVPDAVSRGRDGYLRVDYRRLGIPFMTWKEWVASNEPKAPSDL